MNIVGTAVIALSICTSCDPTVPAPFGLASEVTALGITLSGTVPDAADIEGVADQERAATADINRGPNDETPWRAPRTGAAEGSAAVNVLIANQKTALPRTTDTVQTARKERIGSVARLVRLRDREDANFAYRTVNLARRMKETNRFANPPELAAVTTGEEFLQALVTAARRGPIGNLVVYGHAAPNALYMREDLGFYASVDDIAAGSPLSAGVGGEPSAVLRAFGARDLGDLERLMRRGDIAFARDAVIVFAGCAVAGHRTIDLSGIAARLAELTGATVIASVGVTDQSMTMHRGSPWNIEGSRGTWVRFVRGAPPQTLATKYIDALRQLHPDGAPAVVTTAPAPPEPAPAEPTPVLPASDVLQCASRDGPDVLEARSCGLGAHADVIAAVGEPASRPFSSRR
jgi:hypothetical protein